MPIVHNAVYFSDGRKMSPESLDVTYELLRERHGMGWIGLYRPNAQEIGSVAEEFELHPLAVEDAVSAHQRPKLERYGDTLFTVLRPARFLVEEERVDVGELHVFTGPDFVVTIRHAETPDVAAIRARMEGEPELLALGPEAVLYAVLAQVVDEYQPVVDALEARVDATEAAMFAGEAGVSRRIQALFRELSLFHRAMRPLPGMLRDLASGFETHPTDHELRRLLRHVEDHVLRLAERVDALRVLLQNTLAVNGTLVTQAQNKEVRQLTEATFQQSEQVKRISSWAAILFAPTLIPTVYGMNFDHMPELGWDLGYPFSLLLMALMYVVLYAVFKRRGWV